MHKWKLEGFKSLTQYSLLLRRLVFRMAEASAKRVTGDTPQGTMGRVQTAGEAPSRPLSPSRLPLRAHRERRLGTRQDPVPVFDTKDTFLERHYNSLLFIQNASPFLIG